MPNLNIGKKRLLLVGAGKMGLALLNGWLAAGLQHSQISVHEPKPSAALKKLYARGVQSNNQPADIIVLAVKPQVAGAVLRDLGAPKKTALVLSIMAGVPIAFMKESLGGHKHIVRAMPNTPVAVGQGMTALYARPSLSPAHKKQTSALMNAVGASLWLTSEKQIDAATAISGSGPAYVYHLAETLTASGVKLGLTKAQAAQLARQTIIGAAAMLEANPANPEKLRHDVTSPKGTTEAALKVLADAKKGLQPLIRKTTKAAYQRSRTLSK